MGRQNARTQTSKCPDTNAVWVYAEKPDTDATQIETWLSKALRTSVSRSANPDEDISNMIPKILNFFNMG